MSKAFKIGMQNGKVAANPARLIPQRKEPAGKIRFLTEEEDARLRKALQTRPNCIPQLDVALNTGMRKAEAESACRRESVSEGEPFWQLLQRQRWSRKES